MMIIDDFARLGSGMQDLDLIDECSSPVWMAPEFSQFLHAC